MSGTVCAIRNNWLQFVRFGLVGASGYAVNLAIFTLAVHPLGIGYRVASVLAFLVSVLNNFWWNRHWTFDGRGGHAGFQAARFFVVSRHRLRLQLRRAGRAGGGRGLAEGARAGDRDRRRDAAELPRPEALELPQMRRAAARIAAVVLVALAGACSLPAVAGAQTQPRHERVGRRAAAAGQHRAARHAADGRHDDARRGDGDDDDRRPAGARWRRRAVDPNALRTPPSPSIPPPGFRLTSRQVIAIADAVPKIRRVVAEHPGSYPNAYTKGTAQWQVSYFSREDRTEIGQVTLDDLTGAVREAWTGYQVPWTMARGYEGAFGRRVNAWYVWLPLCVLFVAPFVPWRRRPSWLLVDLLVLLSFSVSLAFFNNARIGLSTPLIYPPMLYLLLRMLFLARRGGRPEPLRLLVPVSWLAVALVFLIGFRVGLNVTNSNVIDVGYSGVIGAHKLVEGEPLYGGWPADNAHGDTYGPVNYLAYIPFERVFGWSGRWDDLPAAHAAAVVFDLLTIVALFFLGRRIRGPSLGIVLAYLWAAFPFTLYVSNTNGNDALVSLLVVCALLVAARPAARGALVALAGLTKFAPWRSRRCWR